MLHARSSRLDRRRIGSVGAAASLPSTARLAMYFGDGSMIGQAISRCISPSLAVGILLSVLSSLPATAQSDSTIRVGIVSPNTGAAARYGTFAWRGAQLSRDEINGAGGILGKKLELFQGDSQCIPTEGVSALQRMVAQDKVSFVIGDVSSSLPLAMQPLAS